MLCSDHAPSSPAPPARCPCRRSPGESVVRTAPRRPAPRPRATSAQSATRFRRMPCPARPARLSGAGLDPRASPLPGPPGPRSSRPTLATSRPSPVWLSRSSVCPVSFCRLCNPDHSFRARVSNRENSNQRRDGDRPPPGSAAPAPSTGCSRPSSDGPSQGLSSLPPYAASSSHFTMEMGSTSFLSAFNETIQDTLS